MTIQENLPEEAVVGVGEAFERYYIMPNMAFIVQDSYRKARSARALAYSWKFTLSQDNTTTSLPVRLTISPESVELSFEDLDSSNSLQLRLSSRIVDDVQNIVWSYFQNLKLSSLYFVVGERENQIQSEAPQQGILNKNRILKRIFSGNATNVFLIFMLLSFILFFVIGALTIILLIVFQTIYLIFSDRIAMNMGSVRPTAEQPLVTIVSVRSSQKILEKLRTSGKKILPQIREQVTQSIESPTNLQARIKTKSALVDIFANYEINIGVNQVDILTRNVYGIVQRVAKQFHRKVPKIVIANSLVSNASATGISSSRSSIMITAGSLEDLNEQELEAVIGHEFGHVKGHDPVILYALTSFELFGRFYLWLPLLLYLGIFYFILSFGVIYAVGKVLETRADTESAVVLGTPNFLASALTKIGLRQLYHEKYSPVAKFLDWFQFDPHPPIYFRIERMAEFSTKEKRQMVKNSFLLSLKDCVVGFLGSISPS